MSAHETLSAWEAFYVIVGSSAAALTGLQFVVIALVSETEMRTGPRELDAFGTPTIVHFCAALLVATIVSAPWTSIRGAATTLLGAGVLGLMYVAVVLRRARSATQYRAVLEDWVWHVVLPFVAYATITASALWMTAHAERGLFGIGLAALLLVFIGIHNAWDTVTYIALTARERREQQVEQPPAADANPQATQQ